MLAKTTKLRPTVCDSLWIIRLIDTSSLETKGEEQIVPKALQGSLKPFHLLTLTAALCHLSLTLKKVWSCSGQLL